MTMVIKHKRGLEANLPTLEQAEIAFTTDTNKVFVGAGDKNLQVSLSTDTESALAASKAYADSIVGNLETKVTEDIATAVAEAASTDVANATTDGLMSKEDKAAHDALVAKQVEWDAKETTEGAQAKADAAEANAKAHADTLVSDLVNGAPEALNTIKELADAIATLSAGDSDGLIEALSGKADKVHTHTAAEVTQDELNRFVTDVQVASWSAKAEIADVTTAVSTAQATLQGNIDAVAARVEALEAVTVVDGGTF